MTPRPSCKCGCGLPTSGKIIRTGGSSPLYGLASEYRRGHFGRRHHFDRSLFTVIETEQDAYWLGFFSADGFVKDRGSFGFHLGIIDLDHLKRFAAYAGATHPIVERERYCRLEIADKAHLPVLAQWGFVQGKSPDVTMPPLPIDLRRHFVRGLFDGDGWVAEKQWGACKAYVGIVGNQTMLTSVRDTLSEDVGMEHIGVLQRKGKADWYASIAYANTASVERLYHYFYDSADTYLERKYQRWTDLRPA